MSREEFLEMSFPKGICVCNLSSPLTFVGLTRFVSAIIKGEPRNTKVVIINIEDDYVAIESDLPAVDHAADRLFRRGILPLLVVPEGCNQVERYFKREARIGTFRSLRAALNSANTFLDSIICGDNDDVSGNARR
jgi:MFS superfamily sulfate permease-like transporter